MLTRFVTTLAFTAILFSQTSAMQLTREQVDQTKQLLLSALQQDLPQKIYELFQDKTHQKVFIAYIDFAKILFYCNMKQKENIIQQKNVPNNPNTEILSHYFTIGLDKLLSNDGSFLDSSESDAKKQLSFRLAILLPDKTCRPGGMSLLASNTLEEAYFKAIDKKLIND
ncbi:MAG: hypothetical protein H6679_03030 [Epsilonproteobacteria bacterium]|nr:hypothetical protein [Campylobacterota bacterium]